jgi:hypothetical protein
MNQQIEDIIKPINSLEKSIISDVDFIEGASYGKQRRGHPEGQVIYHIKEVLENIDKYYKDDKDYENLRIIAMLHDTFKHKVDRNQPKTGENHHGMIARNFAEKFQLRIGILTVIEHHDDAYNAWSRGNRCGDWSQAERRANRLIDNLIAEDNLDLYLKFYYCDNNTGDKSQDDFIWFDDLIG